MNTRNALLGMCLAVVLSLGLPGLARADLIDFEAQGPGPSTFNLVNGGPLVVATATNSVLFDGGGIMTAVTALPANVTTLYGTASFCATGCTNPIEIWFDQGVANLSIEVFNGLTTTVDYEYLDDLGNLVVVSVLANFLNGQGVFFLPDVGIMHVTITSLLSSSTWDFFIDNLNFTTIPEPGTLALLGTGLLALGSAAKRKWRKRTS